MDTNQIQLTPEVIAASGRMVSLPGGMQLLPVSEAEFETAKRIMARWMFEHPEVESLVLRRQDGRQANNPISHAEDKL